MALLGLLIFIALIWFVVKHFSAYVPPLVATIVYVVLVIICVIALCNILGIPMPTRLNLR
jgi:hypothetical protein